MEFSGWFTDVAHFYVWKAAPAQNELGAFFQPEDSGDTLHDNTTQQNTPHPAMTTEHGAQRRRLAFDCITNLKAHSGRSNEGEDQRIGSSHMEYRIGK